MIFNSRRPSSDNKEIHHIFYHFDGSGDAVELELTIDVEFTATPGAEATRHEPSYPAEVEIIKTTLVKIQDPVALKYYSMEHLQSYVREINLGNKYDEELLEHAAEVAESNKAEAEEAKADARRDAMLDDQYYH